MTQVVLDPNGDITGTAYANLSDASDATYNEIPGSTTATPAIVMAMETATMPAGAIAYWVQPSIRMKLQNAGGTFYWVYYGVDSTGTGGLPMGGGLNVDIPTSTITDYEQAWSCIGATQAQINAMRYKIAFWSSSTVPDVRIYEADITFCYVEQPEVTVTAVTDPYTTGVIIPLSWGRTLDDDGGLQTKYQIKVYDETTWGASWTGLDPDTSTPEWTSGTVNSFASTANIGPLSNGETYRAYVRIAQTIEGTVLWSDWDYDEFTISVTAPEVDIGSSYYDTDTQGKQRNVVYFVMDYPATPAMDHQEAQRSVDGGVTWEYVRHYEFSAISGSGQILVYDYEMPNGVTCHYRARGSYYSGGVLFTGAWAYLGANTGYEWTDDGFWLKAILDDFDPFLTEHPERLEFEWADRSPTARQRPAGVFNVVGAAYPVVVHDVLGSRQGQLHIETMTADEADTLRTFLETYGTLFVQFPPEVDDMTDFYMVVTDVDERWVSPDIGDIPIRHWTIGYTEIDSPADSDADWP